MQITHLRKLMIIGSVAIIFASCTKTNTQGKLIPKEASVVMTVDAKALSQKLAWEEIKQNPLFQQMSADSSLPPAVKSLLDNPENAGIDLKSDLLIFSVKDSMGTYIGFEGKVKDENIFKTFNQQMTEKGVESETDGVQYISKSPVCVGFTKEKFVYVFETPRFSQFDELSRRMMRDSISIHSQSTRDIGATCKAVFALKESSSLGDDERFTRLMKEPGDVHFWLNTEEISKGAPSTPAMAMLNLDEFTKGNVTTATMDFENGRMLLKATSYAGDKMTELFKKYSGGKINEDMLKRMPGKDVVAVMAFNFKPEAIRDIIKMTGMDGLVNMGIQKFGFSMDDFIKANKGDILFGLSDLVMTPDTNSFKFKDQPKNMSISQKPSFNFIFSASIGDKEAFNKLVNAGKKLGQGMISDSGKAPFFYNSSSTYFALSNSQQNVDKYLDKPSADFDFIAKMSGESFGGYLNIQTLLKSFGNMATKDSSAKTAYDASLAMWDNILWKGGTYHDNGIQQTVEINLMDKTTNSLKQLNQYAAKMGALYREQRRKQKAEAMAFGDFEGEAKAPPPPPPKRRK